MGNVTLEEIKTKPRDATKDRCLEKPKPYLMRFNAGRTLFPYRHRRPLPRQTADKAISYIKACVKDFPFQTQYAMALPLWHRFAEEWCDTGSEKKSLNAI